MRVRKFLWTAAVMLGMLALLGGCDLVNSGHTHSFSKWTVTKASTCVDEGLQSRECQECGYQESEKTPALGHSTVKVAAVKATCTTDGLTEGSRCGICGETLLAQEIIPAFGHAALKDYAVEPTCTTDGLTEGSHCALCGAVIVAQTTLPASGHKYEREIILTPATCISQGVRQLMCLWCDASFKEAYSTTEHAVVTDAAVTPTCTTDGLTEGSHCRDCGMVFKRQEVLPAFGHKEVADPAVEPDCTQPGYTAGSHCEHCGMGMIPREEIPALGHDDVVVILQEATCQTLGLRELSCRVCGQVRQESYELPHVTDADLYSAAMQYVGQIVTYARDGSVFGGGVGFVIRSDGRIVTSYRAVAGAYSAQFQMQNGTTYPVLSLLAYSEALDIAVLQVEATDLPAAKLCTHPLTEGMPVYALGAARSLEDTFSRGSILLAAKEIGGAMFVEHDAAIHSGNAGGPLVNVYGEVVAVNFLQEYHQGAQQSVLISELEKLNYDKALTLQELYALTTSDYQKMVDMIKSNGTKDGLGKIVIYTHNIDASGITIYGLGYEPDTQRVYLELSTSADEEKIAVKIYLTGDPAQFAYKCEYTYQKQVRNTIVGTIDANTYTSSTKLTYSQCVGLEGNAELMLGVYQPKVNQALTWLDGYLCEQLGFGVAQIGFAAFSG